LTALLPDEVIPHISRHQQDELAPEYTLFGDIATSRMHMRSKDKSASGLHALLTRSGLRPTFARIAIIETLQKATQICITAEHIYLDLYRRNRPIPLCTICRCLDLMEGKGIVTREWDSTRQVSKAKYFLTYRRGVIGPCRFHCRCCGKSVDVNNAILFKALQEQTRMLDFLHFEQVLRVESLCVQCAGFSAIAI
jgi:Fe2+ or Zn2+ uptake regulation protein